MAQQIKVINNSGAYRGSGIVVVFLSWGFAMLPYRIPNFHYKGYAVYTNNPVPAPQPRPRAPQMRFAIESQLDMIAEKLKLDPVEIRLKNARQPHEQLPNGDNVHNCGLSDCIRKAAEHTQFPDKYGRGRRATQVNGRFRRGIGMGVSSYFGGALIYPNSSSVIVKMNDDGTVTVLTGALDIGQGAETILSQIVAEELQMPIEEIHVIAADTETTPVDIGAWISGGAYVSGNAARQAASQVREKLLQVAAEELQADLNNLVTENKSVYAKASPGDKLTYQELVALSIRNNQGDPVIGEGHWRIMRDERNPPSLATAKGRWSELRL